LCFSSVLGRRRRDIHRIVDGANGRSPVVSILSRWTNTRACTICESHGDDEDAAGRNRRRSAFWAGKSEGVVLVSDLNRENNMFERKSTIDRHSKSPRAWHRYGMAIAATVSLNVGSHAIAAGPGDCAALIGKSSGDPNQAASFVCRLGPSGQMSE